MQTPVKVQRSPTLKDGTPVALRLVSGINPKEAKVGDAADFVLDHDLWQGDILIAKESAPIQAVLVEASKAKWFSRGSKLGIDIEGLRLLNGQILPLRGSPKYRGGVGPAADITSNFALQASPPGADYCFFCEFVFVPATVVSLGAPGTNKSVAANTIATAWVDGDINLNLETFRGLQPAGSGTASIEVVRGWYGAIYSRDLYCNGVPLAHLPSRRKLDLALQPGWYRFAINPKKEPLQIHVDAGSVMRLITDYDRVYLVNEFGKGGKLTDSSTGFGPNRSVNTQAPSFNPFAKHKNEREFLEDAKPVDAADRYPTECRPLQEVVDDPK